MDATIETKTPEKRFRIHASAWMISLAVHALIVLVLAMLTWAIVRPAAPDRLLVLADGDASSGAGGGAQGDGAGPAGSSEADSAEAAAATRALQPPAPPPPTALDDSLTALMMTAPAPAVGEGSAFAGVMNALAGGTAGTGPAGDGLGGTSSGFGREVGRMRQRGLDVVLILDATSSMQPTIEDAKLRLRQVIKVVAHIVPNARFGVVAFKDYGDDYGPTAIRTHEITSDREAVQKFLNSIRTGGGGDDPEPIDEALVAAVHPTRLGWRRGAQRVIVLVGDAPVHPSGRDRALQAARQFSKTQGRISTIDVNARGEARGTVLADLERIAACGGGAAFSLGDGDQFWRHLIISVFGKQYAQDVNTIIERVVEEE